MADQRERQRNQQPAGGIFGGGFGNIFQQLFQVLGTFFSGGLAGFGAAQGGGNWLASLFGFGETESPEEVTRRRAINEQQADLAAKGLYPSTGSFAQDGVAGDVMQHAMRLDSDPAYARQYMRQALRDPDMDAMDVMKLQAAMNKLGYNSGDVDGRMDNEARRALNTYLQDHPDQRRAASSEVKNGAQPRTGISGWIAQAKDTVMSSVDRAMAPGSTPGSVRGLLGIIGEHESGQNYNAIWPRANGNGTDFTSMTVNEVIAYQRNYTGNLGNASSAVGRYQIIRSTLTGLKDDMGLTGNERFSPELQDRMAVRLLEQRGLNEFRAGRLTPEQFMDNVAKEWASMPNRHGRGHYDGDGLNKVGVDTAPVRTAMMDILRPQPVQAATTQDVNFQRSAEVRNEGMEGVGRRVSLTSSFSEKSGISGLIDRVDNAIDSALDSAKDVISSPFKQARNWLQLG